MDTAPEPPALDGFEYQSTLGSGGFADVYRYKQRFPRRSVAVKVLRATTVDRASRHQFIAEANTMAQLSNHPAIATVFTAGVTDDDRPYLIMEYCSRGSLGTVYRLNPLPVDQVLRIGVRIASALESAHRLGIIHRDVKPANILITDYGAAVLTDFGISVGGAHLAEATVMRTEQTSLSTLTGDSTTLGLSVPWAPPEALDDEPVIDARSDVYSLAATLFTLLEGRSPFESPGGSNGALHLSRRIERGAVVPGELVDATPELSSLLRRALSVDPADRPQSALAFAELLAEVEQSLGFAATPIELLGDGLRNGDAATPVDPDETVLRVKSPVSEETRPRARTGETRLPQPETIGAIRRRPKRRIALIGAAAIVVLLVGGVGTAYALGALAPAESQASAPSSTPRPTSSRTPTPTPTPTTPGAIGALPGMCAQSYYDAEQQIFVGAEYTVSYAPLTGIREPIVLSTGAAACGHESHVSIDPNWSEEVLLAGGEELVDTLVTALSASYTCTSRSEQIPDFDCTSGNHHVNVTLALGLDPGLGADAVFVWIWAGQYCGEGENLYGCSYNEPW